MCHTQFLMYLFGIFAICCINYAQGLVTRRLKGEGIQGGDDSNEGQLPYQVSLETYGISFCGGSILTKDFVITAAHCVTDNSGSFLTFPLKVVGGINDLWSMFNENRVSVDVAKVYIPKEYDPTVPRSVRTTGDIAILKLNKPLDIKGNPNLGKVKLPKKGQTYEGKKAIVSGFGDNSVDITTNPMTGLREEQNNKNVDKMRYAKANVLSFEECQKFYVIVKVKETHICAALVQRFENQPEGVCTGDSGGPLVYNGVQIGVLSNSPIGCREDFKPAIYTRVSEYLDFINKVVNDKIDKSIRTTNLTI